MPASSSNTSQKIPIGVPGFEIGTSQESSMCISSRGRDAESISIRTRIYQSTIVPESNWVMGRSEPYTGLRDCGKNYTSTLMEPRNLYTLLVGL